MWSGKKPSDIFKGLIRCNSRRSAAEAQTFTGSARLKIKHRGRFFWLKIADIADYVIFIRTVPGLETDAQTKKNPVQSSVIPPA